VPEKAEIQQSWYDDVALLDNTLNTFKYTQPLELLYLMEETCGKFKAHHVKNYPTHYTTIKFFSFVSSFDRVEDVKKVETTSQHFYVILRENFGSGVGRRAESYLTSNKRTCTINKVCSCRPKQHEKGDNTA
jgi:hypothetical protein